MEDSFDKAREIKTTRVTIEQYNLEIDQAIARVKNGDYLTNEEVEQMSKEW